MKKTFESPLLNVIEFKKEDIIATSGENVTVTDPWSLNTEENW